LKSQTSTFKIHPFGAAKRLNFPTFASFSGIIGTVEITTQGANTNEKY